MQDFFTLFSTLSTKIVSQIVLLYGSEKWPIFTLINAYIETIKSKGINIERMSAADIEPSEMISHLCSNSLFGDVTAVYLRDVEKWSKAKQEKAFKNLDLKNFGENILILESSSEKLDSKSPVYQFAIKQKAVLFQSKRLYENQLGPYITFLESKYQISLQKALRSTMVEYTGTDLYQMESNFQKLKTNQTNPDQEVDLRMMKTYLGLNKQYNLFELQQAISKKDTSLISRILHYVLANTKDFPIVYIVNNLFEYFNKIQKIHYSADKSPQALARELRVSPYFVSQYTQAAKWYNIRSCVNMIEDLHAIDLASKGIHSATSDLRNDILIAFKKLLA